MKGIIIIMESKKIKIFALFGESASGKDTIQKRMVSHNPEVKEIVNCTTRPKRDNEIEGIDYYYLTNEKFAEAVLNGDMLEATDFNGWFYGTRIQELDENKTNLGVFNIAGIECLLEDPRLEVYPIYVCAPAKVRLLRAVQREQNPDCHEICRRFLADEKDFDDIEFDYETIYNHGDVEDTITQMDKIL